MSVLSIFQGVATPLALGFASVDTDLASVGVGVDYRQVCRRIQAAGNEDAGRVSDAVDAVLSGGSAMEMLDYSLGGRTRAWWELRIAGLNLDEGGAVLTHADVTWRHDAQQLLQGQAQTDLLTGLANRLGLLAFGAGAMARGRRSGRPVTVVFMDLDAFKPINDRYGHPAGDEVLKQWAQRLQQVVRETDGVARVGGDEFVLVCESLNDADLPGFGGRLRQVLSEPIRIGGGVEVAVGASIGMTQVDGTADLAQTIAEADKLMYAAKRQRRSTS